MNTPPEADRDESLVYANGVNAETGTYLIPPLTPRILCEVAQGNPISPAELEALEKIYPPGKNLFLSITHGVNAARLEEAGWGILFTQDAPGAEPRIAELREALAPLLAHRKAQAGALYREFAGEDGYVAGEDSLDFLARFGAGPGPVRPSVMPYYLVVVGDPGTIPFEFQYQLDVIHAVGRLCFDTPDEYAAYARAVVESETKEARRGRSLGFFAPCNPGDVATRRSSEYLARKLASDLRAAHASWQIEERIGEAATKTELARMLGGDRTPALLFTAGHGVGFPCGHDHQRARQGALLCQDWPGKEAGPRPIPPEHYFAAADLAGDADLRGMVAFFFACFGAGTPARDDFAAAGIGDQIAPTPFVSRLPQRMLAHGALAVIGHVDRAWGYSFEWPRAGTQIETFRATVECLMEGLPVGYAVDYFNERYATISTQLTGELRKRKQGKQNDTTVAGLWTANHDARNYAIMGDPAVRLAFREA